MGKKVERMKNDKGCVEQILASPKPTWAKEDGGDLGIGEHQREEHSPLTLTTMFFPCG